MTIHALVAMAETIHDAEGHDLGSNSTRDSRNAYWARVIGCAYWGHPRYNDTPDTQWHLKKASETSPQSDDVATSLPSRQAWDCIPGAGSDGYRFDAEPLGVLPPQQVVYAPPRPSGSTPAPQQPQPPVYPPYPGDVIFDQIGVVLFADYAEAGQGPNPGMGRWFGRTVYDFLTGMTMEASIIKHRKEWRQVLGLPPI